ncbi:MAG: hypothetical protein GXP06_06105 [Alphaproteobacteria bacterium]|nr:hypothetical protein [Alphaproteobacteria bacterium]
MHRGLRQQRDRISLYFLFGLFVLLPLTVVFGHKGVAPWLLLASLPAFARGDFWQSAFGQLFDQPDLRNPFFFGFASIIAFCMWIFLSGFWSPRGQPSLAFYVLAPVIVGGSVVWFSLHLSRLWSYRLSYAYAISITAGMAVLLFEGMSGGLLRSLLPPDDPSPERSKDIIALGRGVTALAPALFPAAIIVSLIWNRYVSLGLLLLGVAAAFSNDVTANAVAISAGLVAGMIAFKAPRRTIMFTGWTVIVLLLLAPLAALLPVEAIFQSAGDGLPSSWLHRVAIWQSVAAKIPGGLPFGYGADFARAWQETAPLINVPGAGAPLELMPTHPHNIFLQIWLELGLPGVLTFTAFVYCGMKVLKDANPPAAVLAAIVGAIAAIAVSMAVEGSLWQVWRLAAMALAGMGAALAYSLQQNWSR